MNRDILWNAIELNHKLSVKAPKLDVLNVETEMLAQLLEAEGVKVYRTEENVVLINNAPVMISTRNLGTRESFETWLNDLQNSFGVVLKAFAGFTRLDVNDAVPQTKAMARVHIVTYKEDLVTLVDREEKMVPEKETVKTAAHVAAILEGVE
jgi:hypothetical protein